jgi:predicted DNA-binding ribbon-helix-helix protein
MKLTAKSAVAKRSVVIGGHKTSVSLEEPFWNEVRSIAEASQLSVSNLLQKIDGERQNANLSSAIRVYVLHHLRGQANAASQSEPAAAHTSAVQGLGL